MKSRYKFTKLLALILMTLMLATSLAACTGRPLAQTKLARTEVGKVGNYNVLYEELYFLATNYEKEFEESYKDDPDGLREAVWNAINENITENYAILELCKTEGLIYDEKALSADVSSSIAYDIESSFAGDRQSYFESQAEYGLTDHYVRFLTGVNMLYSEYAAKVNDGDILPSTEKEKINYIQENFVHTWHIAVFVNDGDDYDKKFEKINAAKKLLDSGTSMYDLIGSEYNEDVTLDYLSDTYGYYFPRGIMDEKYENAAFEMNVGENAIVESYAENIYGQRVKCFYLIEKLSTSTSSAREEIEKNLVTLSEMLSDATINQRKEDIQSTLSFEANDFAKSLDIIALDPAENGTDYQVILIITLSVLCFVIVVVTIIVVRRVRMKKFQKSIVRK